MKNGERIRVHSYRCRKKKKRMSSKKESDIDIGEVNVSEPSIFGNMVKLRSSRNSQQPFLQRGI